MTNMVVACVFKPTYYVACCFYLYGTKVLLSFANGRESYNYASEHDIVFITSRRQL